MIKSNTKIPYWLPYTSQIQTKKNSFSFVYKGGECSPEINKVLFVMFYGAVCDLDENFLQTCAKNNIPICIHRRNMTKAIWITPSIKTSTKDDILTKQILFRENEKKRIHIAKKILQAKFKSMEWLVPYPIAFNRKKYSIKEMTILEAHHAKEYWQRFYEKLNCQEHGRRSKNNTITTTLDTVSKLISGVTLRYIIYHNMSPYHGFIHIPNDYPALVYDLMEPYRGYIEKIVFNTIIEAKQEDCDEKEFLPRCIVAVEEFLNSQVYTTSTRQVVTFQELIHGSVLALRSYLQGNCRQMVVPIPGKPNGGRPIKTGYKLYGRSAGPTNFWQLAENVSTNHERIFAENSRLTTIQ